MPDDDASNETTTQGPATSPTPASPAFALPPDLTAVAEDQIAALAAQVRAEFDTIYSRDGVPQPADVTRAAELADALDALAAETGRRTQAQATFAALHTRMHPPAAEAVDAEPAGNPADAAAPADPAPAADPAPVTAAAGGATAVPREVGGTDGPRQRLNPSLAQAAQHAPNPQVPDRVPELVITAAAATADAPIGHRYETLDKLVASVTQYARGVAVSHGSPSYIPLATVRNRFDTVLSENTHPSDVEAAIRKLTDPGMLVAAGGWCAPSETRYDFFNVACQSRTGLIDLPTFGVERGGIRFPVSPSLADVFPVGGGGSGLVPFAPGVAFTAGSMPWLWSESDDIAAVTGAGTKPCIRVPCPSFADVRLECFGICLTAGNLTDSAYPEATRNFLSLLMASMTHVANFRFLTQMAALSTNVGAVGAAGSGTAAPLLGAIELAAIDYRTKYGMCETDVLEVVLPTWVMGTIRSDLSKRTGVDLINVSDAMIADWFDSRGVRVQLVSDYQVRSAGFPGQTAAATAWPTTVEFMIYAAGTFGRGNGLMLDLGVVRDSVLNAKNDHTAAWMEECHLIARFGHESRRYTVNICTDGTTGAADLTACGL